MKNSPHITLSSFVNNAGNIPASLVRAVVNQIGGWDEFITRASDVASYGAASYGAAGGFAGFTYYSNTLPFTRKNRAAIVALCETMADDLGASGPIALVRGFRCLKDSTEKEVRRAVENVKEMLAEK